MTIRIYQPDLMAGKTKTRWLLVHEADISFKSIEELCEIFGTHTTDPRRGIFRGHPLNTGDIVEVEREDKTTDFYKFTSNEWTDGVLASIQVDNPADMQTCPWNPDAVTGVLVSPGERARIARINLNDQKIMKQLFGQIHQVVQLPTGECIICNDIAFRNNADPRDIPDINRMLKLPGGEVFAAVSRSIFFCNVFPTANGDVISSLTEDDCKDLIRRYDLPEKFYTFNGKLMSVTYYPNLEDNAVGKETAK